jgi:DNA-binding CsgD family transcriptional regulator
VTATGTGSFQRSFDRIDRLCEFERDDMALRLGVLDELAKVVRFDAHVWLLTDPETSVGSAPLADVPCVSELPQLIRLKYGTRLNRWTQLYDVPVGLLAVATGGTLSRIPLWRDLLCRYEVRDVASLVLRDRFGCWGFLDLWRLGDRSPFDAGEAAFLTRIAPPVTAALRRCQAATFVSRATVALDAPGPAVLLLSPDLSVLGLTPQTEGYLRALLPPSQGNAPIPAAAYNVAAQLLAVESLVDTNSPSARVHVADGLWVTLRAARIGPAADANHRDIAVSIELTTPADRTTLFSKAFGFSQREDELLHHLVEGADTRELASRMFLSEHTVQDHLKSIFDKAAVRSRRSLVARCLGT